MPSDLVAGARLRPELRAQLLECYCLGEDTETPELCKQREIRFRARSWISRDCLAQFVYAYSADMRKARHFVLLYAMLSGGLGAGRSCGGWEVLSQGFRPLT